MHLKASASAPIYPMLFILPQSGNKV